ncbi:MAG: hypothetical protein JXR68_00915, partial [Bacteroidales bacterium]|nr:hypothetical protein [Bacteroidales bacterium]
MSKKNFNFFNQVFNKKNEEGPSIKLGKYSNRNKTLDQLNYWEDTYELYKKKEYLKAAEKFFMFIKDPVIKNVTYVNVDKKINFKFYQGSKQIIGYITPKILYAFSDVIIIHKDTHLIAEKLLKINYNLKFCKFSLEKNKVICEIFLHTANSNPTTLYYALREIAITTDRYDDVLMMHFTNLEHINNSHIIPLPEEELNIKTTYFKNWTTELLNNLDNYDAAKFVGARAFLMLSYLYKISYLLSPEGELLEKIKKTINIFYNNKSNIDIEKNAKVYNFIKEISEENIDNLKKSFYTVFSTFSLVPPTTHNEIIKFIKKEINKINWYEDNKHKEMSSALTDYIIGYCCYNFGNEPIIDELFKIYWKVMHSDFFNELKVKNVPVEKNRINYFVLNNSINTINWVAKKTYPKFNFNVKHLSIVNIHEFAKSF